jgi:tryptophan halogenase
MDYGWMWKIPLQHRYGCGYVYDSDFITDEEAKQEIERFLGYPPIYPRETPFNFNPGCYKEVWKNNCIAVGLSGSFLEPLEATSIWQAIILLQEVFTKKENIFKKNKTVIKNINKKYLEQTLEVRDFIYLHYITDKTNNSFWSDFTKNNEMPETLKEKIDLIQNSILYESDHIGIFSSNSYYRVAAGLNLLNKETIGNIISNNDIFYLIGFVQNQNEQKNEALHQFERHTKLLKSLGGLK